MNGVTINAVCVALVVVAMCSGASALATENVIYREIKFFYAIALIGIAGWLYL